MKFLNRFQSWLHAVIRRSRMESEMDAELRFHIEAFAEDLVRNGVSLEEAFRRARIEFGGVERAKEECREARRVNFLDSLVQDLRFGLRMLRKSPGFTAMTVLTLALGIGANTAIYSLIDQAVLRWLPIKNPEQLFELKRDFLIPEYEKLAGRTHSFSEVFASDKGPMIAGIDGMPENIWGKFVSGTYYSVTGIQATLGRAITPQDDHPASPPVCVLTQDYWKRRFGSSPGVLGKTIELKRTPFVIVGVAPEFDRGHAADLIVPMATHLKLAMKDNDTVSTIGRLKPGLREMQASAELTTIYRQILAEAAGSKPTTEEQRRMQGKTVGLIPAGHGGLHQFSMELRIAAAVVGIILLIACINVGNLLLARGTTRQREIAVRLAIGAGRWRIIRQLLTESILLALLGGCLGLLLAWWDGQLLSALISGDETTSVSPDVRVLGFSAAVSLLTGIGFGLLPAMRTTRTNLTPSLKANGPSFGGTSPRAAGSRWGLGNGLVVAQIGLCSTLLIGAGLLLQSLAKLNKVNVGFDRDRVLLMWVLPTMVGYDVPQENSLYWQLLDRLNALPGVQSASLSRLQLFSGYWGRSVSIPKHTTGTVEDSRVSCNTIAPKFFTTMGIPLLSGRDFTPADTASAPRVAIISDSMARQYFPGQNPIGSHFQFTGEDATEVEIVGVVKDILTEFREEQNNRFPRAAYIPFTQAPSTMTGQAVFEIRAAENPSTVAAAIHEAARALDKVLPVGTVETQNEVVNHSLGEQRSLTELTAALGLLALLLASIGLYGTISHSVGQRTKEIGIRMALGAERRNVLRMVLREGMVLTLAGISVGIALGAALTRLISSQLYGLSANDPLTFLTVSFLLLVVALLAIYIPARRAMRVDPIVALRYE